MSGQTTLWTVLAVIVILAVGTFAVRELAREPAPAGQPSPHALDQSQ